MDVTKKEERNEGKQRRHNGKKRKNKGDTERTLPTTSDKVSSPALDNYRCKYVFNNTWEDIERQEFEEAIRNTRHMESTSSPSNCLSSAMQRFPFLYFSYFVPGLKLLPETVEQKQERWRKYEDECAVKLLSPAASMHADGSNSWCRMRWSTRRLLKSLPIIVFVIWMRICNTSMLHRHHQLVKYS